MKEGSIYGKKTSNFSDVDKRGILKKIILIAFMFSFRISRAGTKALILLYICFSLATKSL